MNGQAIGGFNVMIDGAYLIIVLIACIIGFIIACFLDAWNEKD